MQKYDLNDILKQHAAGFEIKPASASFDKVMQRRNAAGNRRKIILWSMAASVAVVAMLLVFVPRTVNKTQEMAVAGPQSPSVTVPVEQKNEIVAGKGNEKSAPVENPAASKKDNVAKQNEQQNNGSSLSSGSVEQTSIAPVKAPQQAVVKNIGGKTNHRNTNPKGNSSEKQRQALAANNKQKQTRNADVTIAKPEPVFAQPTLLATNPAVKTEIKKPSETDVLPVQASSTKAGEPIAAVTVKPVADSIITPQMAANVPDSATPPLPDAFVSKSPKQWHVTAVFTPQLFNSVYNANSEATLSWMKQYLNNREQNDKALYSYNVGLKVERDLGHGFSVSAGVLYSIVKFEEIRMVNQVMIDSASLVNNGGNPMTLAEADRHNLVKEQTRNSFDISFSSLEVPVQFYYTLNRKKMYYQANAGVAYSYLFKTRSLVFDESDSLNVQETDDAKNDRLRQHNILLMGGINVGYRISKRWSCYMGPVFRYSLNSIYSKDYIIRQQPYYLGLETGVRFSF
jgi:hypothetical protein